MDKTNLHEEQSSLPALFILIFAALFLLGMHYFQLNFGGSGLHLPFNVLSWLFISGLVSIIFLQIAHNKTLTYSATSLHFLLIVALLCIPLTYGFFLGIPPVVLEQSIPRLLGLLAGLLLFIGIQQFKFSQAQLHIMMYAILGGVFIEAVFGLVQYYLMSLWPIIDGKSIGFIADKMRPFGIFQQPNVMATFMATGLVLALYLLAKNNWHRYHIWAKLLLYSLPFLAALLLVLNLSRTGMLSALIGLALLSPLAFKAKPQATKLYFTLLLAGIVVAFLSFQLADKTGRNITAMSELGARLPTYLHSLEMIQQKPVFGWGYGTFEAAFLSSVRAQDDIHKAITFGNLDHPHNELLYWAIEGGLITVFALGYAAWLIFGLFIKAGNGNKFDGLAMLGLCLPILLHTQTEYPFYHAVVLWLIFVFLLFMADRQSAVYKTVLWPPTFLLKLLALVLPLFMFWFVYTTLTTCYYLGRLELSHYGELSLLDKISNPIAFNTSYQWIVKAHDLRQAIEKQNTQDFILFESWAEQTVQHTPRPEFYQKWVLSLQLQGKDDAAKKIQQEAKRLYPWFFK